MDRIYIKQLSFQLLGLACLRCSWCSCTCVGLHIVSPGIPKAVVLRSTFSKPAKPATVLPCSVSRLLRINQRLLEAAMRICDRWANGYVPFFRTGCEMTKKKQIRPCCSSSTNRVANLRPPQPHKQTFLFGCQWQPRKICIVLCIYAEFPNFWLNILWIWRNTNSGLKTTNRGKTSQWVRNGSGYNSLSSLSALAPFLSYRNAP